MKKLLIAIALIFLCGTVFSQIYVPVTPTVYGIHQLRVKSDSAQHVPEKDSLYTNTFDTSAQVFYNRQDSSIWAWSLAKGFWKIGSSGGGSPLKSGSHIEITHGTGDTLIISGVASNFFPGDWMIMENDSTFNINKDSVYSRAQTDSAILAGGGGGVNIYNTDGILTGDRRVWLDGRALRFSWDGSGTDNPGFILDNGGVRMNGGNPVTGTEFDVFSDSILIFPNHTSDDTTIYKPIGRSAGGGLVIMTNWSSSGGGGTPLFPVTGTGTASGNSTADLGTNRLFVVTTAYPDGLFSVSNTNGVVNIGDQAGDINNVFITVDDANKAITISSVDAGITMDGVAGTITYFATNSQSFTGDVGVTGTLEVSGGAATSFIRSTGGVNIGDDVNNVYLEISGSDIDSKVISHGAVQFTSYTAGAATFDGSGNITSVSDRRAKHDINPFKYGLTDVLKLNPSTFIYNQDKSNTVMSGFIAQDVQNAIPIAVHQSKDKDGMMSLETNAILGAAINAIKELNAKIEAQQKEIDILKSKIP